LETMASLSGEAQQISSGCFRGGCFQGDAMRRAVILAILVLAVPMAAWADGIDFTNQFGSISISAMAGTAEAGTIGSSVITSTGSQLASFMGITAPKGHSLGSVSFSTGALTSGSISAGGTFSATGSSFIVTGRGNYGQPKGTIFSGSFVGPIDWSLVSKLGQKLTYTLTGTIRGTYDGKMVSGTVTDSFYTVPGQLAKGIEHISLGTTQLSVPEPGTLGLLGTGLIGIAGIFRRKLFRTH